MLRNIKNFLLLTLVLGLVGALAGPSQAANSPKTIMGKVTKADGVSFPSVGDIRIEAIDGNGEIAVFSEGADPEGIITNYDPAAGVFQIQMGNYTVQWANGNTLTIVVTSGTPGVAGFEYGNTAVILDGTGLQNFATDPNLDFQLLASQRDMEVTAGDGQTGTVGASLPIAVEITVTDDYGDPVVGVTPAAVGDGAIALSETDGSGKSTGIWTLGNTAGAQQIVVSLAGYSNVTVNATATAAGAAYLTVTDITDPLIAGAASDVTVTAYDAFDNIATGYTGTIAFTSTDGQADLPADYTFLPSDNGTKTLSGTVILKTAGERAVTATDTTTGITGVQGDITVIPAPAATLIVSDITDPVVAGVASDVTVTAYDAFGNIATGYTGTVAFTSTDGQAVLPANYTFQVGDNGTKTIDGGVTLKTVGDQTVTATDTVTDSITGAQTDITVNHAPAATLQVTGITDPVVAGVASDVTLTAYDEFHNIATGYTGTVAFTATDDQADLPENYTFLAGDNGTKTIAGAVTLKTVGDQTVTATDTVTDSITGAQTDITVNHAPTAALEVSGVTDPVVAGVASDVTVTAYDAFDNIATGYTGTVAFTATDDQAELPANYTFLAGDNGTTTIAGAVTLKTVGDQTVTATDTVTDSITGAQTDITVNPAAAAKLHLTADKLVVASDGKGSAALTVQLRDAFDNNVPQEDIAIDFDISDATTHVAITGGKTDESGLFETTLTTVGIVDPPPATTDVTAQSPPLADSQTLTFTIVNFSIDVTSPAAPFYDGNDIHLVTSGSEPSTATFAGMGGTTGNYRWELASVGEISSTDGDTTTYTAPPTITLAQGEFSVKDTLNLADAVDANLTDAVDIYIYNPVAIAAIPANERGIVEGVVYDGLADLVSGGTGTYEYESSDPAVATVHPDTGVITAIAAGTFTVRVRDVAYGDFGVENGFMAETPELEVVVAIDVTGPDAMQSGGEADFTADGGTGVYVWETTDGTIDEDDGTLTAPFITVDEGNRVVTVTARDAAYPHIFDTADVTVFAGLAEVLEKPAGYDPEVPATWQLLTATTTFRALDDTRQYTWEVLHWDETTVIVTQDTGAAIFALDPDVLFNHSGAGVYTVKLTDKNNPGLAGAEIKVRVPMRFQAQSLGADRGTYYTNALPVPETFQVLGGPDAADVYYFNTRNVATGLPVTDGDCGSLAVEGTPTASTNDFIFIAPPEDIVDPVSFRVNVYLYPASDNADVQRLIAAELDEIWSGVFSVVPVVTVAGRIMETDGVTPIQNATIMATHHTGDIPFTAADGTFNISYRKTGAAYQFNVLGPDAADPSFLPRTVTLAEIEAGDILLERLPDGSSSIQGRVNQKNPVTGQATQLERPVRVKGRTAAGEYITDGAGVPVEAVTGGYGGYLFPIPADFAGLGDFTLEFRGSGYAFFYDDADPLLDEGVLRDLPGGTTRTTDPSGDITLNPATAITVEGTRKAAVGGVEEVDVVMTAAPAFDGSANEIAVTMIDATGTETALIVDVNLNWNVVTASYTYTGQANADFSLRIKADTSTAARDAGAGYVRTLTWRYFADAGDNQKTESFTNPAATGGTETVLIDRVQVTFFAGSLDPSMGDCQRSGVLRPAAGDLITGSDIFELDLFDGDNPVTELFAPIAIRLPTNLTKADFQGGAYGIYKAVTRDDLVGGVYQHFFPYDDSWVFEPGFVTFQVDRLSAFGAGLAPPPPQPPLPPPPHETEAGPLGGSSGCFISTVGSDSTAGGVMTALALLLAGVLSVGVLMQVSRRRG